MIGFVNRLPAPWAAVQAFACSIAVLGAVAAGAQAAPVKRAALRDHLLAKGVIDVKMIAHVAAVLPRKPATLLRHGCLESAQVGEFVDALGWPTPELQRRAMAEPDSAAAPGAALSSCVPFASLATGGQTESLALLSPGDNSGPRRALVIHRGVASLQSAAKWQPFEPISGGLREVWLPVAAVAESPSDEPAHIPIGVQRELSLLVRQMSKATAADGTAQVRVMLEGEGEAARLAAVELFDGATGRSLDTALWVSRDDAPGAFISAQGAEYERSLWQSPLDYQRISRGIGASVVVLRQRVLAKPRNAHARPRYVVRNFRYHGQHIGIDFVAPSGTPVVTVADGTVVHAAWRGGYGNLVIVDHGAGHTTHYGHLSAFAPTLAEGTKVKRGELIGQVGTTGMSTGPHLHFEIRKDGLYMDPADPDQQLAPWALAQGEQEHFLTRLLQLAASRPERFMRAASAPAARQLLVSLAAAAQ